MKGDWQAHDAYFIKLGARGIWEQECIEGGYLRLGYRATPPELCEQGRWEEVRDEWTRFRGDRGTGTRDMNQIRTFYEANETTLFVTFWRDRLCWCRPAGPVSVLGDRTKTRGTVDGWHDRSLVGTPLTLAGQRDSIARVRHFKGTICRIRAFQDLLEAISGH